MPTSCPIRLKSSFGCGESAGEPLTQITALPRTYSSTASASKDPLKLCARAGIRVWAKCKGWPKSSEVKRNTILM